MTPAQIPPHNLDAERAVLGAVLLEGVTSMPRVAPRLRATDFYLDNHRVIYEAMIALAEADHPVDLITVSEALRRRGQLEAAGGPAGLALLVEHASIAIHLDAYVDLVLEHAGARERIQVLMRELERAYGGKAQGGGLLDELAEIEERSNPDAVIRRAATIPIGQVLAEVRATLAGGPASQKILPTPIVELNERLGGGLHVPEVVILGGRPGTAKSALAMQWTTLVADYGFRTLVVSCEMANAALGRRILAQQAQVGATTLRKRDVDEAELRRLERALPRLSALPIDFADQAETLNDIRRLVRRTRPAFVVVDYLQLVRSPADAKDRRREITAISNGFKQMAKRYGCVVLALSALRRLDMEKRGQRRAPALEDLKESGDVEADADVVLLLHQPKPDSHDRELIFAKLREGETGGAVTLDFTPVYVRFTEVAVAQPDLLGDEPGAVDVPF